MSDEALAAPAELAPAELPAAAVEAALLTRPVLTAGGQPQAVVILMDVDAKGST